MSPWIENTLSSLSIEEKVGQLLIADLVAVYSHREDEAFQQALEHVQRHHVGAFSLAGGTIADIALTVNALQEVSKVPLLVAADIEDGLWFSHPWRHIRGRAPELPRVVRGGGTLFPSAMALAAAGSRDSAYHEARVVAQEGRAIGVNWSFAPVADVNMNPHNPIVNARSFGEDPETVAGYVEAYVRGLEEGNMLSTLKHFPGHGDSAVDTHMKLPRLPHDRARLDTVELVPFRRGIAAGARSVMTGHLALPAIDATGKPASLSYHIVTGLLRKQLKFDGLVVNDAFTMQGITDSFAPDEAAVLALEAGSDMILVPGDFRRAREGLLKAVRNGTITSGRLDESVRRILAAKEWLGLHQHRFVDPSAIRETVGSPRSLALARELAERSITLLRNTGGIVPLKPSARLRVVVLTNHPSLDAGTVLCDALGEAVPATGVSRVSNDSRREDLNDLLEAARQADGILLSLFLSTGAWRGEIGLSGSVEKFIEDLGRQGVPVIVASCGDPYVVARLPVMDAVLLSYGEEEVSQMALADALLGKKSISGKLPVSLPRLFKRGDGLSLKQRT